MALPTELVQARRDRSVTARRSHTGSDSEPGGAVAPVEPTAVAVVATDVVGAVSAGVNLEDYHQNLPPAYVIKGLNNELGVTALNQAVMSAVPDQMMMLCSRNGQPLTTRTDGYGFRNPAGAAQADTEIMVLGDSL